MADYRETDDLRTDKARPENHGTERFRKVIVIGCPGAGKSTFARKLHELTGLPLYYLDRLFHREDRTVVSADEFDRALGEISSRDRWIIDGNYLRTMEMRLGACDTVFFLDLPVEICLEGAASRIGKPREDMPWTEPEFDPEFRQYIIDFPKDQLPRIRALLDRCKEGRTVITLRSRGEMDHCLAEIGRGENMIMTSGRQ